MGFLRPASVVNRDLNEIFAIDRKQLIFSGEKDRRMIAAVTGDATADAGVHIVNPEIAGKRLFIAFHRAGRGGDADDPERFLPKSLGLWRGLRLLVPRLVG